MACMGWLLCECAPSLAWRKDESALGKGWVDDWQRLKRRSASKLREGHEIRRPRSIVAETRRGRRCREEETKRKRDVEGRRGRVRGRTPARRDLRTTRRPTGHLDQAPSRRTPAGAGSARAGSQGKPNCRDARVGQPTVGLAADWRRCGSPRAPSARSPALPCTARPSKVPKLRQLVVWKQADEGKTRQKGQRAAHCRRAR